MKTFFLLTSIILCTQMAYATRDKEIKCVPGVPLSQSSQVHLSEVTYRMHWVGDMMQGYYAGTMELKGEAFVNGDETIDAKGNPHYWEFTFWGDGAYRYIVETYSDIDDQVGTSYIGTFKIQSKEGWEKSTPVICTKTL